MSLRSENQYQKVRIMHKRGPASAEPNAPWQSSCFCPREMSRTQSLALETHNMETVVYRFKSIWPPYHFSKAKPWRNVGTKSTKVEKLLYSHHHGGFRIHKSANLYLVTIDQWHFSHLINFQPNEIVLNQAKGLLGDKDNPFFFMIPVVNPANWIYYNISNSFKGTHQFRNEKGTGAEKCVPQLFLGFKYK